MTLVQNVAWTTKAMTVNDKKSKLYDTTTSHWQNHSKSKGQYETSFLKTWKVGTNIDAKWRQADASCRQRRSELLSIIVQNGMPHRCSNSKPWKLENKESFWIWSSLDLWGKLQDISTCSLKQMIPTHKHLKLDTLKHIRQNFTNCSIFS